MEHILIEIKYILNPLSPELNTICYLLTLLAHNILHVSRIRFKDKDVFRFNFQGSVHHKNILIYIQQDATLHS
jgi:transposase